MGRKGSSEYRARQTRPRTSASQGAGAVLSSAAAGVGPAAGGDQPERRGAEGSSDDVWVVPRPDHAAVARADCEVVLGNVPTQGLGAVPGPASGRLHGTALRRVGCTPGASRRLPALA